MWRPNFKKPSLDRLRTAPGEQVWDFFMSIGFVFLTLTLVYVLYTERQEDIERDAKDRQEARLERIEDAQAAEDRDKFLQGQADISNKYQALLLWLNSQSLNPPDEVLQGRYTPSNYHDDDDDDGDDSEGDGPSANNGGSKSGSITSPNPQPPQSNSNSNSDKSNSGGNGGGGGESGGGSDKGDKGDNGKSDKADKSSSSSKNKPK